MVAKTLASATKEEAHQVPRSSGFDGSGRCAEVTEKVLYVCGRKW